MIPFRTRSKEFSHLGPEDRKTVLEILTGTKPEFAGWKPLP